LSESKLILKAKLSKELEREIVDVLIGVEVEVVSFEPLVDIEVVSLGLKVVKVVS